MKPQDPIVIFDRERASHYDTQFARLAPMREVLYLIMDALMAGLPEDAHVLCVGAGTGAEILHLAQRFPGWRFTAVDPSGPMLEVCRRRTLESGIADRCEYHEGYLDSLPVPERLFDAATSVLVSQFVLNPTDRTAFFHNIALRLRPGGLLVNADLASDIDSPEYESLLEVWLELMKSSAFTPEKAEQLRAVYRRDVALLPVDNVNRLIAAGGFETPVLFLQTVLIHGWYASKAG